MQYRIEHVNGWKSPAIIRVKDMAGIIFERAIEDVSHALGLGVGIKEDKQ